MKKLLSLATAVLLTGACQQSKTDDDVWAAAYGFAYSYFNYNLQSAREYATDESYRWLSFVASNMTEADIEALHGLSERTDVEVTECALQSDTTAVAWVAVSNFLEFSAIGGEGRIVEDGRFELPLVLRGGRWLVRMGGPLQSEKPGRD